MTDLLTLASLLPLLPLFPLIVLAIALAGELARELRRILADIGSADPLTLLLPIDRPVTVKGPMVRFLQEERTARAVETARYRGDPCLAIRASIAWQAGDYGRAMALAGASCRIGR